MTRPRTPPRRPTTFEIVWPIVFGAVRDVVSLGVGVWILLFKDGASVTLQMIGFACLGISASGAAVRILERITNGNGNGRRRG